MYELAAHFRAPVVRSRATFFACGRLIVKNKSVDLYRGGGDYVSGAYSPRVLAITPRDRELFLGIELGKLRRVRRKHEAGFTAHKTRTDRKFKE